MAQPAALGDNPLTREEKLSEGLARAFVGNAWAEMVPSAGTIPSFNAVDHLLPNREYRLVFDLAATDYGKPSFGVSVGDLPDHVLRWLLKFPPLQSVSLRAALQENPEAFKFTNPKPPRGDLSIKQPTSTVTIDLRRVRRWVNNPNLTVNGQPLSLLASNANQDFVYGRAIFRIKTGEREGKVGLKLTLKSGATQVGVLSVQLCIAEDSNIKTACPREATAIMMGDLPDAVKELRWNVWGENIDPDMPTTEPRLRSSPFLKPNKSAFIALDLAAIAYGTKEQGVLARSVDDEFKDLILKWLQESPSEKIPLTIVAIPDPGRFTDIKDHAKTLTVNVPKIKALVDRGHVEDDPKPFETLASMKAENKEPDWKFGGVSFEVTTGTQEGEASLALSVWVGSGQHKRPVDEIAVKFCIASSEDRARTVCNAAGVEEAPSGLSGIDSLRLASEKSPFPDAALHFVPLDANGPVMGVFRRNDRLQEGYTVWPLEKNAADLKKHLAETLLDAVAKAKTNDELRTKGGNLYDVLFSSVSDTDQGHKARLAFEAFIRDHVQPADGASTDKAPSLFVRLVSHDDVIPLGLLPITTSEGGQDFLGFRFRVETPLKVQSYQPQSTCISSWALVVPPANLEARLETARRQAEVVIGKWELRARFPFNKMGKFESEWLGKNVDDPSATALLVMSHHDRNQLFFTSNDSVLSDGVRRRFTQPSIAILNGCSTAKPAASEFITQLNKRGITTVISTSAEIEASMAGDFLNCLDATLDRHKDDTGYTVGQAYMDTIRCLKDDKQYGARALKYVLLGNGNLRLCLPKKP